MKHKSILALVLVVVTVFTLGMNAYAATSTTATVPVTLTVANEYRAVNVTVPAALPVHVINGTVVTADNAVIRNNSKSSAVQVTSVSVTDGAYKVGDYENFSGKQTIALKINGCPTKGSGKLPITADAFPVIGTSGSQALTYFAKVSGDAQNTENLDSRRIGFILNGTDGYHGILAQDGRWTAERDSSIPLSYDAVVSATSEAITGEQVLTVVFVVDWAR